ncbi:hypothetical protein ACFP2T_08955 [Plantactinospora solaniradicis]|uniref:ANTAR domain-containing protein n=1 Tax=Plantactinospora solaniradicis TaxID=1723736 RepID=A0ABW1K3M9_9ACTN
MTGSFGSGPRWGDGSSAEAAFARLHAYAHDRRLGDVARDVVERRLRFRPDPPGGDDDGQ